MNIVKPVKNLVSVSILCTVIALSSIASVYASNDDMSLDAPKHMQLNGDRAERMMNRMIRALSLSDQQQVQIVAIKAQAKEQHNVLRDSMKKFKEEEKTLLQAQAFDEQAYTALHGAYQPVFVQMALIRAKTKHAIFNVLTTAQQEKWLRIMGNRKEKFKKKRG